MLLCGRKGVALVAQRIVWRTDGEVPGDAWTDFLPESAKLIADWENPEINCGNYNTETKKCSGQNY